jgi:hypothetical protein
MQKPKAELAIEQMAITPVDMAESINHLFISPSLYPLN